MGEWFHHIIDSSEFMPFGHCYHWQEEILTLQIIANGGITLSFLAISSALIRFVKIRRDLEFRSMFYLFGAFISSCALAHLMHIITIWNPIFRLEAIWGVITSALSMATAIILWSLLPKALRLPSPAMLAAKNSELSAEIDVRKRVENDLRLIQSKLETMVEERTKALQASEEKLVLLVDGIDCYGLLLLDHDGKILSWNAGASRITGYSKPEVLGVHIDILSTKPDQDSGIFKQELGESARHGVFQSERELTKRNKETFWAAITTHVLRIKAGEIRGYTCVISDETARFEAQIQMKQSEEKFRAITESLPQLVWSAQSDGTANYFNSRWLQYTGTCLDDNYGQRWTASLHPDERSSIFEKWSASVLHGSAFEVEARVRRHDGYYEWHLLRGFALPGQNGNILKWLGTGTNIEILKQAEQQLQKAVAATEQISQAKSQFLANMSHEIRTPLGAMLGFVHLLKDPNLSGSEKNRFIQIIARNGENLLRLVDDLLDKASIEAGMLKIKKEPTNLRKIVSEVSALLEPRAKEKPLNINVLFEDSVPDTIETDPLRLSQILTNIIGNAIKFTEKGEVIIKVGVRQPATGKLFVQFLIEDTGIGIKPEYQRQLFQVFSQADYQSNRRFGGAGLGLALSKHLAELLGGSISLLRTQEGYGSAFCIEIDAGYQVSIAQTRSTPIDKPNPAEPAKMSLQGCNILVAEDAPDNQALLSYILTKHGANVQIAANGQEAVTEVKIRKFDLIIMDIQMPIMDGFEALRNLREMGCQQPIIALTAHAYHEEKLRCLNAGFNEHITKPVNERHIIDLIASYWSKRKTTV